MAGSGCPPDRAWRAASPPSAMEAPVHAYQVTKTTTDKLETALLRIGTAELVQVAYTGGRDWVIITREPLAFEELTGGEQS